MVGRKSWPAIVCVILGIISIAGFTERAVGVALEKPRVIVTTDGGADDISSMVRFLMYANEFDIEGLIYSSSGSRWSGKVYWSSIWIEQYIVHYDKVYQALVVHDPDYPSPGYLMDIVRTGNIATAGDMEDETPGSQHIVSVLLDRSDDREVWLQAWGGCNTIARALKTIEEKHPSQKAYVEQKAVIIIAGDQDGTYENYILPRWRCMTLNNARMRDAMVRWEQNVPEPYRDYFENDWMLYNILEQHDALCDAYPVGGRHNTNFFGGEGDSPCFMHEIRTGLRQMEDPAWGGWGGRFYLSSEPSHYSSASDEGDTSKPIYRWAIHFQNDWACRADWCLMSYDQANHPPIVELAEPLDFTAESTQRVDLVVAKAIDPDGDELSYNWWRYADADSCKSEVKIHNAEKPRAFFTVPRFAATGDTIHIICEVTDDGEPPLTRYGRVIVTVE